eukprot:3659170-Pyramimonas_sp.AAC.1
MAPVDQKRNACGGTQYFKLATRIGAQRTEDGNCAGCLDWCTANADRVGMLRCGTHPAAAR